RNCADSNLLAARTRRGKWSARVRKRLVESGAAKNALPLVKRRHGRKCVYRTLLSIVLVVREKVRAVFAVVNVRNCERTAYVCSKPLVVVADFWKLVARQRIWFCIEC